VYQSLDDGVGALVCEHQTENGEATEIIKTWHNVQSFLCFWLGICETDSQYVMKIDMPLSGHVQGVP
jgi:hypothetical protein